MLSLAAKREEAFKCAEQRPQVSVADDDAVGEPL